MKLENNWKFKTLEKLEKDYWKDPEYTSHLATTCHRLRKIPINDFSIEDLRIMIGQNIGLDYLIPMALEKLSDNILSECDFFEGDLLLNMLRSDKSYWESNGENWKVLCNLFIENKAIMDNSDILWSIKKDLGNAYFEFERINKK